MKFIRAIFFLPLLFILSSFVTQPPAPIEHGSSGNSSKPSASEGGYYDTPIESKGKLREFWGDKEVTDQVAEHKPEEQKEDEDKIAIVQPLPVQAEIQLRKADISHEVIEGETLDSIAKKYGLSRESIISKNKLNPPYQLEELQILKIPPQNSETPIEILDIVDIDKPKHEKAIDEQ